MFHDHAAKWMKFGENCDIYIHVTNPKIFYLKFMTFISLIQQLQNSSSIPLIDRTESQCVSSTAPMNYADVILQRGFGVHCF